MRTSGGDAKFTTVYALLKRRQLFVFPNHRDNARALLRRACITVIYRDTTYTVRNVSAAVRLVSVAALVPWSAVGKIGCSAGFTNCNDN